MKALKQPVNGAAHCITKEDLLQTAAEKLPGQTPPHHFLYLAFITFVKEGAKKDWAPISTEPLHMYK